jgi:hypothetical protein
MLSDNNIHVVYSGPIWASGVDGMAEMLTKRLEFDDLPLSASQSVFSIFVEQVNNMMMYSAEKETKNDSEGHLQEISKGTIILGTQDNTYFVQSGNVVSNNNARILKSRIDYLNTLNKKELRQYHKERIKSENDNPESKGAGIGLIEIARRSSFPIEYEFEAYNDELQYFSMYITITQGGKE